MVKVSVRSLASGNQAQSVEEALEALRRLWKEDDTVRRLLTKAAKEGYVLVDTKDMPAFTAAVKVALARLRERLGKKPSTLVIKGGKGKEERKPMTWEGPDGVVYAVEPSDLTPREERHWAYRDKRVEDAAKWLDAFLGMREEEERASPLEDALEHEDNPHFQREDVLPEDLKEALTILGWDGSLRNLQSLVDTLPAREKDFVQRVRSIAALVDRKGGKAEVVAVRTPLGWEVKRTTKEVANAVLSIGLLEQALQNKSWSTAEVRRFVKDIEPFVPGLLDRLFAIATLRRAKHLLEELGRGRRIAVYRDPATREPVYRTPVIG